MRVLLLVVAALLLTAPLCAQTLSGNTTPSRDSREPIRLALGKPVERELKGGETHTYVVYVEAGQFVHLVVLQKGVDVTVTLLDPNKNEIAKTDSLNGSYGPEPVSAIAALAGEFRLQVAANAASDDAPTGHYEVQLLSLHTPTDLDRTRLSAERAYMEGMELWRREDAPSFRTAAEKWQESLRLWQSLADNYGQALSLYSLAGAFSALQQREKALESYSEALPLWRAATDPFGETATLNQIGVLHFALGQKQKALDDYAQALPLSRADGDRVGEAATLNNIGATYDALGEKQKALDHYAQALSLYQAAADRDGQASTLNNLGLLYDALGERQKALDNYGQALQLRRTAHDRVREATLLSNIGGVYFALGEIATALNYYNQALVLCRALTNLDCEAITLTNIGEVYSSLGERPKALDFFAQALPLYRTARDPEGEATTLNNIGGAYRALGEDQKALTYYEQAVPLRRALADPDGEATTLTNLGTVYDDLGERQKALDHYQQALPLYSAVGDRDGEAAALTSIGSVFAELGEKDKALDSYAQALSLARRVRDPIAEAHVLVSLMSYWKALNRPSLAIFFGKQGIDRLQQVRRNLHALPTQEQQSFLQSNADYYRKLAGMLIEDGRLPEAQEVLDFLKLEEYSEYSRHRGAPDSGSKTVSFTHDEKDALQASDTLLDQVTALGLELDALARKSPRTPDEDARYNDLSRQLNTANRRMQDYFNQLYDDFGKGDQANENLAHARGESSALRNLLRGMRPGIVGLYTLVLDQKCVLIVITPGGMVPREVPITKLALRAKVFDFVGALGARQPEQVLLPKAQELYKTLIAPIEPDLAPVHPTALVWSLDDVLRYLPLAALHDGQRYLAERFSNVVVTTTGIGDLKDPPHITAWSALAMGVSKDYDGAGALTAVPAELQAIVTSSSFQGSHGPMPGTILLNDAFTEKSMVGALSQPPPLVHIATHFFFSAGDDEGSYLLLGGKETGGEAYHLSLANLRDDPRLNFAGVELLTLSSCQTAVGSKTGTGRDVDSLGIVGQMKGAKAVLATLWKVHDASVGLLMENFYRRWTTQPGMTKAEALRQAQLSLLHGETQPSSASPSSSNASPPYANPYYWAPFVLIGNWQ